jgi:hypothetical protein
VGILLASGGKVELHQFFLEGWHRQAAHEGAEALTIGGDGPTYAYVAPKGAGWVIVVGGKEGPEFDRVVSPLFSPDGRYVVYRARKDGRRFVVVADLDGRTIRQHPSYEQVFAVRFTAEGKSIAYGVKDGRRLAWKVEAP